jgi:hypothetical protein
MPIRTIAKNRLASVERNPRSERRNGRSFASLNRSIRLLTPMNPTNGSSTMMKASTGDDLKQFAASQISPTKITTIEMSIQTTIRIAIGLGKNSPTTPNRIITPHSDQSFPPRPKNTPIQSRPPAEVAGR